MKKIWSIVLVILVISTLLFTLTACNNSIEGKYHTKSVTIEGKTQKSSEILEGWTIKVRDYLRLELKADNTAVFEMWTDVGKDVFNCTWKYDANKSEVILIVADGSELLFKVEKGNLIWFLDVNNHEDNFIVLSK